MDAIPAAYVRSLVRIAVLSRVSLLLLALSSYHLLPSYDESTELFFEPGCSSSADRAVISTLSPLLRWDALQFLSNARDGYQAEKNHAFFPLLPAALSATARPLAFLFRLCPSTALLLSAFLLNWLWLLLSVPPLYRLSLYFLRSPSLSYLSCVLWLLSPSAVFLLSGGYTECLFACCVFWGLWFCATDRLLLSSSTLCLAAWTRSNGALLCIFPLVQCSERAYSQWRTAGTTGDRQRVVLRWIITSAVCTLLIVGPSLLYSHISSLAYCAPTSPTSHPPPPYCAHLLPSMYSHVQSAYWHVGAFRYWQPQQLPNFLLAAPVLVLGAAAVRWVAGSGEWRLWVYGLYLFVLLCVCGVVLHVQVSTRFLSSVPLLYWYGAWCWQQSERKATWLLSWSVTYMIVGTVLFSLFLPWT